MLFDDPYEWALTRGDLTRARSVSPSFSKETKTAGSGDKHQSASHFCTGCGEPTETECLKCRLLVLLDSKDI